MSGTPALISVVDLLVVHHSASARDTTLEEIRRWHLERGFEDVGYHYVVEERGHLRIGRTLPRMGAHCLGVNDRSIGVCVTGDNRDPAQRWCDAQLATLRSLIAAWRFLVPGIAIVGHSSAGTSPTLCPAISLANLELWIPAV